MYWRVRKITPEQMLRRYGIHVALGISLLLNGFFYITRPNPKKISQAMQMDLEAFVKSASTHLLDSSYITYRDSTSTLMTKELAPAEKKRLIESGLLPRRAEELEANARDLESKHQVSAIRIEQVNMGEPTKEGYMPFDVSGTTVVQSSDEGSSTAKPVAFHFRFMVGMAGDVSKGEVQKPIILRLEDRS
jgi:hypothetical protein